MLKHHCQLLFCELTRICLSIKRACLNRAKYGQELHERMDMLYTSSEDEIGPFMCENGD